MYFKKLLILFILVFLLLKPMLILQNRLVNSKTGKATQHKLKKERFVLHNQFLQKEPRLQFLEKTREYSLRLDQVKI